MLAITAFKVMFSVVICWRPKRPKHPGGCRPHVVKAGGLGAVVTVGLQEPGASQSKQNPAERGIGSDATPALSRLLAIFPWGVSPELPFRSQPSPTVTSELGSVLIQSKAKLYPESDDFTGMREAAGEFLPSVGVARLHRIPGATWNAWPFVMARLTNVPN